MNKIPVLQQTQNNLAQIEQLFDITRSIVSLSKELYSESFATFRNNTFRTGFIAQTIHPEGFGIKQSFYHLSSIRSSPVANKRVSFL